MDIIDCSKMDSDRIKTFQGDQGNKDSIQSMVDKFGSDFDIILDDGSHWVSHQQISFGVLFQHLKPGGYYIIEDLHTSLPEFYPYRYDVNEEETNTTLGMLIDYIRTADLASEYLTEYEIEYIMLNAEWVALHHQVGELQSITGVIRKKEVEVVPGR